MQSARLKSLAGLVLGLVLAGNAQAALIGADFVQITASNEHGSGSWKLVIPPGWNFPANGVHRYQLPAPVSIWNGNHSARLAVLESLDFTFIEDPVVSLGLVVQAGAVPTTFGISSATLSFPALSNPGAAASSAVTITDTDGDGVALTGLQTGGKAYRGTYNGSVDWALLNSSISDGAYASVTSNDRRPAAGLETIAGSVSSIESQYYFTLSANDLASATSVFTVVIPEPAGAFAVLMAGSMLIARRRAD